VYGHVAGFSWAAPMGKLMPNLRLARAKKPDLRSE